jgi:hypothetical protein
MKFMCSRLHAVPQEARMTRFAENMAVCVGACVLGALPAASFGQSAAALTAEEAADLAPLLPRPAGTDDEPLAPLASRLALAIAAERLQLQPAAVVARAGQRVPFTLTMAAPVAGQAGAEKFIIEQWRVDGIAGGSATVGTVVAPAMAGAAAGEPVAQAQAAYLAPAQLQAAREVTVSAIVRIGVRARNRVEVLARVLLLGGPFAATLTWDTHFENLQAQAENRGSGARIDNSSSSATTRHRASGALAFAGSELAMRELATGRRMELYADTGFAQAEAAFFLSGWRRIQDAWCDERSSFVQAAAGQVRKSWQAAAGKGPQALAPDQEALVAAMPAAQRDTMRQALAGGPKPDAPRLLLQLKDGALRAQFHPPSLRVDSTLEDHSDYSRRCRSGARGNDDVREATRRPWTHGATNVGISTPVLLQRQDDGSWQWTGNLPDPIDNATRRQATSYRITVRTK